MQSPIGPLRDEGDVVGVHPGFYASRKQHWAARRYRRGDMGSGVAPAVGIPVRLFHLEGKPVVFSADGFPIGSLRAFESDPRVALFGSAMTEPQGLLTYLGPDDLWVA